MGGEVTSGHGGDGFVHYLGYGDGFFKRMNMPKLIKLHTLNILCQLKLSKEIRKGFALTNGDHIF